MSKRWIFNYLLLFLIILMTWVGQPNKSKPEIHTLLTTHAKDIDRVKIETKKETLSFKKEHNQWYLTEPVQWLASNINLKRIVSLADVKPPSSLPSNQIDLSTLGLGFPKAAVTLNKDTVTFGDTNQIGSRRYVLNNNTVHLIPDNHLAIINLGLTGLINKSLIAKPIEIKEMRLPNFTLTFNPEKATWAVDKPPKNYSADQSNLLINHWQTKQATQIKAYNKKSTPLKKITANTSSGNIVFYLLHIQPELVLARPDLGLEYHFDADAYYDFFSLAKQKQPLMTEQ